MCAWPKPTVFEWYFLKVKILVAIFVTATANSSPNFKQWDMVLSHFVIMVQNYGTPSQQRLRSLKIYTITKKMLLNAAHQLNVMCSSYNDIHDVYIYIYLYVYISYVYLYIYYSIWNLSHHLIGFICSSVYHLIKCNLYWTISLYMWDLWCGMSCLRLILSWFLNPFFSMFTPER